MVNIFSKQSVLCTLCFSMQCVKHSVYRKQMFCTFCCYQGRIQKISEGVAVCRGGGDYDQKTVFKAYSRRQNASFFVSTKKKFRRGGGRRIAYRWIRHWLLLATLATVKP